eukprot:9466219-Pyramimonas_sp.AAC.1
MTRCFYGGSAFGKRGFRGHLILDVLLLLLPRVTRPPGWGADWPRAALICTSTALAILWRSGAA